MNKFLNFFRSKAAFVVFIILLDLILLLPIGGTYAGIKALKHKDFSSPFSTVSIVSPDGEKELLFAKDEFMGRHYVFYKERGWSNAACNSLLYPPDNEVFDDQMLQSVTAKWNKDQSECILEYDGRRVAFINNLPTEEPGYFETKDGETFLRNLLNALSTAAMVAWFVDMGLTAVWLIMMIVAGVKKKRLDRAATPANEGETV